MKRLIGIFLLICVTNAISADRIINLTVDYKTVLFAGKTEQAIAVNDQIPGPLLHFKEGDHVTIHVYNHLNKETAIHWHGVLVPWQMDGVLGVSQHGIPPNGVYHYQFTLKQSGTYWYHAHAGLQEQQGLYGAFMIDPLKPSPYSYSKDYVIVLSDWNNSVPDQVMANLKKSGEYYSPRFPLQPSLMKFIQDYHAASPNDRQEILNDYQMMQTTRMGIYDLSDVAYDAFLLNGHSNKDPWSAPVKIGDTVRLRFIGAGGDTLFHIKIPGSTMTVVHVEGNDVIPYEVNDFMLSPGETYDVLVKIKQNHPYIIYAESRNTLGAAYGALVTAPNQFIPYHEIKPFTEPLPVTREMMENSMSDHHMDHTMSMNHAMTMPIEPTLVGDSINGSDENATPVTIGTKYQHLIAKVKTNNPQKPVDGVINMELFGYMNHYIWFINGIPEYKAHPIILQPNKRYRIVFINHSMMHHPMHIHGHWLILRNGHGIYDPLLHTVDISPGATVTADLDTDASGQWIFHCHLLYHMVAGMSRIIQYSTLIDLIQYKIQPENIIKNTNTTNRPIIRVDESRPLDLALIQHPVAHAHSLWFSSLLDIGYDPYHNDQRLTYKGLYGADYNKLELFTNDAEVQKGTVENADIDIFYWHLLSQFWAIKGGANYFYRPATIPYWQPGIGVEGLMPYFIDTDIRGYYRSGSAKLDIEFSRDTQITNNFFIRLGLRSILATKTISQSTIGSGLNQMRYIIRPYYRLAPGFNIIAEYEHEQGYGPFRTLQTKAGNPAVDNTLTFGFSWLF